MRIGCSPPVIFFGVLVGTLAILIAVSNPFYVDPVKPTPTAIVSPTASAGCSLMDPHCYRQLSLP